AIERQVEAVGRVVVAGVSADAVVRDALPELDGLVGSRATDADAACDRSAIAGSGLRALQGEARQRRKRAERLVGDTVDVRVAGLDQAGAGHGQAIAGAAVATSQVAARERADAVAVDDAGSVERIAGEVVSDAGDGNGGARI